jgi:hypothetical protein
VSSAKMPLSSCQGHVFSRGGRAVARICVSPHSGKGSLLLLRVRGVVSVSSQSKMKRLPIQLSNQVYLQEELGAV